MDIQKIVKRELSKYIDEDYRVGASRFFKHEIDCMGVRAPIVRKISKEIFHNHFTNSSKKNIFNTLEELMTGRFEEISIALYCSYMLKKEFEEEDYITFYKWIDKYVKNWAHCDEICTKTFGHLLITFPNLINNLDEMVKNHTWLRRAAYVSLIPTIRKGNKHSFALSILTNSFNEKEDIVQKGAGWLLREMAKVNEDIVYDFVLENVKLLPRTTLRISLETMSKGRKSKVMKIK